MTEGARTLPFVLHPGKLDSECPFQGPPQLLSPTLMPSAGFSLLLDSLPKLDLRAWKSREHKTPVAGYCPDHPRSQHSAF
jgi:hypothetical protein